MGRLRIVGLFVQQHSHGCGRATVDHKLYTAVSQQRAVRQRVTKLQRRQRFLSVDTLGGGSGLAGWHGAAMIQFRLASSQTNLSDAADPMAAEWSTRKKA